MQIVLLYCVLDREYYTYYFYVVVNNPDNGLLFSILSTLYSQGGNLQSQAIFVLPTFIRS